MQEFFGIILKFHNKSLVLLHFYHYSQKVYFYKVKKQPQKSKVNRKSGKIKVRLTLLYC